MLTRVYIIDLRREWLRLLNHRAKLPTDSHGKPYPPFSHFVSNPSFSGIAAGRIVDERHADTSSHVDNAVDECSRLNRSNRVYMRAIDTTLFFHNPHGHTLKPGL